MEEARIYVTEVIGKKAAQGDRPRGTVSVNRNMNLKKPQNSKNNWGFIHLPELLAAALVIRAVGSDPCHTAAPGHGNPLSAQRAPTTV